MKLGTNQPMGPLELADLIGLDTCLAIMEVMHRVFGDDKYRPCPLLKKYVDAGYLGRKAGRGFYIYDERREIRRRRPRQAASTILTARHGQRPMGGKLRWRTGFRPDRHVSGQGQGSRPEAAPGCRASRPPMQ